MTNEIGDLTYKQRAWLLKYIQTGNATDAAFEVYECKDRASAASIGSENLRKLDFSELMDELGLSDIYLLSVLKKSLADAIPGSAPQIKCLELAFKLRGRFDFEERDPGKTYGNSLVIFKPEQDVPSVST